MSAAIEGKVKGTEMCCASCGIAGVDDVKLKKCTACYLVRYCSVACQKTHRPKHKHECRKRATELRDELLFKQPETSHHGDCPICCLPLPVEESRHSIMACCSKIICLGCNFANQKREEEGGLERKCAFCRHPIKCDDEELEVMVQKMAEANDPFANYAMGIRCYNAGDYKSVFDYWTKAANSGNAHAHHGLSTIYRDGHGVEKNKKKQIYHLEEAAIAGASNSKTILGCIEQGNDSMGRAVKHWIIAAKLGDDNALKAIKLCYKKGIVSKDDFASALRAHQAFVNETKSPQRDEVESMQYDDFNTVN